MGEARLGDFERDGVVAAPASKAGSKPVGAAGPVVGRPAGGRPNRRLTHGRAAEAGEDDCGSDWTAVWVMPNATLDEPIEASHAALVNGDDPRLRDVVPRHPGLERHPTSTPVSAFGGFRDAVCIASAQAQAQALSVPGASQDHIWTHAEI
jgi:hypothetical protein